MSRDPVSVNVEILEKEYIVACPEDERAALIESARMLNERLREVRDGGKVLGTERMAVITALNLMNELNQYLRTAETRTREQTDHVRRLHDKLRGAISHRTEPAPVRE